jgi:hypothetical protein
LIFCTLFDQAKSVKGFADVKAKILGIKKACFSQFELG